MRGALAFDFGGMTEVGEQSPQPRGLDYVRSGEYMAEPGDLLAIIPAVELLPAFSAAPAN